MRPGNRRLAQSPSSCHPAGVNNDTRSLSERILCFLLRYIGGVSMLAMVAVCMPYTWMDATHRWLGMGALPANPVVGYLARSLSLFYALLGGLLVRLSFDPRRFRHVLLYLGAGFIVFGAIMWMVDFAEGLPPFWKYSEGPIDIFYGVLILGLASRLRSDPGGTT
jgi:hypothetical protein